MNRRRRLLVIALAPLGARAPGAFAQPVPPSRVARIALLDDAPRASREALWSGFSERLREHGRVEGASLVVERRWADGDADRLPALATELVGTAPDVIVAVTTTAALAAKRATSRIPIVAIGPADPVKSGLIASLARPGGNLTGVSPNQLEIAGKWLELLREIVPRARRVAYLSDGGNPGESLVFDALQARARARGIAATMLDGRSRSHLELAFASLERDRPDGLIVATTAALLVHRDDIVAFANRVRLPAVYARREYADHGGLVAYGNDGVLPFVRAADYVDRILKGARPADMPFEMASRFTMVLNLRTARALGLAIPQSVRDRAEEIIR